MLGVVTIRRQVGGPPPQVALHHVDFQRSAFVPHPALVPRLGVVPRPAVVPRQTVGLRLTDVLGSADGSRSVAGPIAVAWLAGPAQGSRPP